MTLDKLSIGDRAYITTVGGEGALRRRLLDMGITPRTRVSVRKMAPLGDPMEIKIRGYELTLRKEDAGKIGVECVEKHHMHHQSHSHHHGHHNGQNSEYNTSDLEIGADRRRVI